MAKRGRKKAAFPAITAESAHAVLRWMHAVGTVTSKDIERALSKRTAFVAEIRAKLEVLGGQGLRFLTGPAGLTKRAPAKRAARKVSAKARAAWKTQGQYLGAMKQLTAAQRAKVKKIRNAKGVRPAIAVAKRLAK